MAADNVTLPITIMTRTATHFLIALPQSPPDVGKEFTCNGRSPHRLAPLATRWRFDS